ncbi:hypothetical protein TWF481_006372 [Arthrobotrys musiformis]|uniref:Secreted protein n=1 Tax=Arthrobotrys musiformis TaxID=47236 RepID=A0AAV9WI41_9PEZI
MLSKGILPLFTLLLAAIAPTSAEAVEEPNKDLTTREVDPNAPPLCRLKAEWIMIAQGGGKDYKWPQDQVRMHVWVKDDKKAGWSGWPSDANAVFDNFQKDLDAGQWSGLTDNLSPEQFSSTCDASERGQCWTELAGRPKLRASPQHGFRDDGFDKRQGNRIKLRDYVHFYYGALNEVKAAWHTDDNGRPEDMFIGDIKKDPYCRLTRDDPGLGVSWQYYHDGSLHVYVDDRTDRSWVLAEGWNVECLFFCPP